MRHEDFWSHAGSPLPPFRPRYVPDVAAKVGQMTTGIITIILDGHAVMSMGNCVLCASQTYTYILARLRISRYEPSLHHDAIIILQKRKVNHDIMTTE